MRSFLLKQPLILILLPAFFVLHGSLENFPYVPIADAVWLWLVYSVASTLFAFLMWLVYRNRSKAALYAFSMMAFHFFFGSIQDALQKAFPGALPGRYVFILPFALAFFIVLFIKLKKNRKPVAKTVFFLNTLFLILIGIDGIQLLLKQTGYSRKPAAATTNPVFKHCSTCAQPDVWFILTDEYAGNTELKDEFNFDNTAFEEQLRSRGFYVPKNSRSNYNYTPFSVASTLNMSYLTLKDTNRTGTDLTYTYETIRDSRVYQLLTGNGYRFYNYSIFDFEGQPARTQETFLPSRTRLITAQTFLSRIEKNILFNLVTRLRSRAAAKRLTYYNRDNNERLYQYTLDRAVQKEKQPRFVYTHLMMPHYPYYYDEKGQERPYDELQEGKQVNREHYVSYLKYANPKIIHLIDHIRHNATTPPVIILLSDHGFRHFEKPVERKYYFLNLQAVLLPSKNYTGFHDSLTNVNLMPLVMNNEFGLRLPLRPDSLIYLKD